MHLLGPVNAEGRPLVELDGSQTGGDNLQIWASHCRIYGLAINRCPGAGIRLVLGGNSRIHGNFLGTDVTGTVALRNGFSVDLRRSSAAASTSLSWTNQVNRQRGELRIAHARQAAPFRNQLWAGPAGASPTTQTQQ